MANKLSLLISAISAAFLMKPAAANENIVLETDDAAFVFMSDDYDPEVPYKFIYYGDFTCGFMLRRITDSRYQGVAYTNGFKLDGQFIYPCYYVIERRDQFMGKTYRHELNDSEWRIKLNYTEKTMNVRFNGKTIGDGSAEFEN